MPADLLSQAFGGMSISAPPSILRIRVQGDMSPPMERRMNGYQNDDNVGVQLEKMNSLLEAIAVNTSMGKG
jgi:hypothetical protein